MGNDYPKGVPGRHPSYSSQGFIEEGQSQNETKPSLKIAVQSRYKGIWKYYKVIKITPVVIDKLLVILLTIPIIDSTLELNIYRIHNLPAIPPGHKIATTYLLEGDYFTIGKHGVYAALPNEQSIQVCLESDLAICMIGQGSLPNDAYNLVHLCTIRGR